MLELQKWSAWVKCCVSQERWEHTLRVVAAAQALAHHYPHLGLERVRGAALLHDCAKDLTLGNLLKMARDFGIVLTSSDLMCPQVLHGPVGAAWIQEELRISDWEIIQAVRFHTIGSPRMSALAKIIFVADYIEDGRRFPGVGELRRLAQRDLEQAVVASMDNVLTYLVGTGQYVHPRMVASRNFFLLRQRRFCYGEGKY